MKEIASYDSRGSRPRIAEEVDFHQFQYNQSDPQRIVYNNSLSMSPLDHSRRIIQSHESLANQGQHSFVTPTSQYTIGSENFAQVHTIKSKKSSMAYNERLENPFYQQADYYYGNKNLMAYDSRTARTSNFSLKRR
jgi:hypothetical protein